MTLFNHRNNHPTVDITPHVHFEMKDPSELENLGYLLIGDQLISYAFYNRLFQKFSGQMFFFETADSIENICGPEFWVTLTPAERKAVGICVLALIQQDQIFFTLDEEEFSESE